MPLPQSLGQAALGGMRPSGGGDGVAAALQQFMQVNQKGVQQLMQVVQKLQTALAQQQMQATQQIGATVTDMANRITAQSENAKAQQDRSADMAEQREFALDVSEYQRELEKQVAEDARKMAQAQREQVEAANRYMVDWEKQRQVVPAATAYYRQVVNFLTEEGYFDEIPDGLELRKRMLHDLSASEAWNENHFSSHYADRVASTLQKTLAAINAGEPYSDLTAVRPDPGMLRIRTDLLPPEGELDLPTYTAEELAQIKNRSGYPPSGVFALDTGDPAWKLVNPTTYSFLMKMRADDEINVLLSHRKAHKEVLEGQAKQALRDQETLAALEQVSLKANRVFGGLASGAVTAGLSEWIGGASMSAVPAERALTQRILHNLFADTNPAYAQMAMQLTDPANPLALEGMEGHMDAAVMASGLEAVLGAVNASLESDDSGQLGEYLIQAAQENPSALASLGLKPEQVQALAGGAGAGPQAVAVRRAVWKLAGRVNSEIHGMLEAIDQQGPVQQFRDELSTVVRSLDLYAPRHKAIQSPEYKPSGPATLAGDQLGEGMDLSEEFGDPEFFRPMSNMETLGMLYSAAPDKATVVADLLTGGKVGLKSPSFQAHQESFQWAAQRDPYAAKRASSIEESIAILQARMDQARMASQAPQAPPASVSTAAIRGDQLNPAPQMGPTQAQAPQPGPPAPSQPGPPSPAQPAPAIGQQPQQQRFGGPIPLPSL